MPLGRVVYCCVAALAETPEAILDCVPALMNNLGMLAKISRHYADPAHLAPFLRKIATLLIK